jgi:COP9 signalosome complex subunit 6
MSIADHYTRTVAQYSHVRVYGALMGTQGSEGMEIADALAINVTEAAQHNNQLRMELKEFGEDQKLYNEIFPDYEVLGWYAIGSGTRPEHEKLHQQLLDGLDIENPVFLVLDPACEANASELPIHMYEQEVHVDGTNTSRQFVKTTYTIRPDDAERVTAIHCSKVVKAENQGSAVSPQVEELEHAVSSLRDRVKILRQFLRDVEHGKIEADHQLLRSVKSICNCLPTMSTTEFDSAFLAEFNDAKMVALLASITKGSNLSAEVVANFNQIYSISGMRGDNGIGGRGPRRRPHHTGSTGRHRKGAGRN